MDGIHLAKTRCAPAPRVENVFRVYGADHKLLAVVHRIGDAWGTIERTLAQQLLAGAKQSAYFEYEREGKVAANEE